MSAQRRVGRRCPEISSRFRQLRFNYLSLVRDCISVSSLASALSLARASDRTLKKRGRRRLSFYTYLLLDTYPVRLEVGRLALPTGNPSPPTQAGCGTEVSHSSSVGALAPLA